MKFHYSIKNISRITRLHFNFLRFVITLFTTSFLLISCSGDGSGDSTSPGTNPPAGSPATAAMPTLGFDIKTFRFAWTDVSDATFYKLMENPDGVSGFNQVGSDIAQGTQKFDHSVALFQRINASYILQSCNSAGCRDSVELMISGTLTESIGYFKASNTGAGDEFGLDVSLSADGTTLAVGAKNESSDADGINGDENNNDAASAGTVYVYVKSAGSWSKQAYIKASVSTAGDNFGAAVSLSADGNKLAVGAPLQNNSGRVHVFTRSGSVWSEQDILMAEFPGGGDFFGNVISLSDDGSTLAVGAPGEDSTASGLGSNGADGQLDGASLSGAAYIFTENAGSWVQQEYFKSENSDGDDLFGSSVSLSADGNTFAVGAIGEASDSTGIASSPNNNAADAGAVYVFSRNGNTWMQQEYIKPDNTGDGDNFGTSVSLSDDGNTLAVGAIVEDSVATGIDGNGADDSADGAGAAYVFTRGGAIWTQQAYIKASNTDAGDNFGRSISLSADGNLLAVGAEKEQSSATGINGNQNDNSITGGGNGAGAAYVYIRNTGTWSQRAYVKASNSGDNDFYGTSLALSADGETLAVGADTEDSNAVNIGGDASNNGALGSGAIYLY